MNNQTENFLGNNSVNINGHYCGDTYQFNGPIEVNYGNTNKNNDGSELFEKQEKMNMWARWILTALKLCLDIILAFSSLAEGFLFEWLSEFLRLLHNPDYFGWFLLFGRFTVGVLSVFITIWLVSCTYSLTVRGFYSSLRRIGSAVYIIRPHRCPYCNSKMHIVYNSGNYIKCMREPQQHSWSINFSSKH